MKKYEVIVSEIEIRRELKFDNYHLIPYKNPSHQTAPYIILLIYESQDLPFSQHASYVSLLLSFLLRRRISPCYGHVSEPDISREFITIEKVFVPSRCYERFTFLLAPYTPQSLTPNAEQNRLKLISELHQKIKTHSDDVRLRVLNSLRLFQLAQWVKVESRDLAFALLVVAIETLATHRDFLELKNEWLEFGKKEEWEQFFKKNSVSPILAEKIQKKLVDNEYFLQKKFTKFIKKYLPDSFFTEIDPEARAQFNLLEWLQSGGYLDEYINSAENEEIKERLIEIKKQESQRSKKNFDEEYRKFNTGKPTINKDNLDDVLKTIYSSRSQFFHLGNELPINNFEYAEQLDIVYDIEKLFGNKKNIPKGKFHPNLKLFERLVHRVILESLKIPSINDMKNS